MEASTHAAKWSQFAVTAFCDPTIPTCGCESSRLDSALSFNWGLFSPLQNEDLYSGRFPSDYFSAQWKGFLTAPASGVYTIVARSDYGVVVAINGVELLRAIPVKAEASSFTVTLKADELNSILVSYFHLTDEAHFQMTWSGPLVPLNSVVDGRYLSYEREISNSPFTLQVYPGPVSSAASSATGSGLLTCTSLETCGFEIQARDSSGNNVYNDGSVAWNVSIRGVDDWAGYGRSLSRVNDVNMSAVQIIAPSVVARGWSVVGQGDVVYLARVVTIYANTSGLLSRGDSLRIGSEVLMVDMVAPYTVTSGVSYVPIARPYLGRSANGLSVYRVLNCTTGKYVVSYPSLVRGAYSIEVRTPAVDEVQQVFFSTSSSLNGSYTLSVTATSLGRTTTLTTTPLYLGSSLSSAAAVLSAINALTNVAAVSVNYSGCSIGNTCSYLVTFHSLNQDIPLIVIDASAVTGNALVARSTEITKGVAALNIAGSPFSLTVAPNTTSSSFSTAHGQGLVRGVTGVTSSLTIQSKDAYGNNRLDSQTRDTYRVRAFIAQEAFGRVDAYADGVVAYAGEGSYGVTYRPIMSGAYTVAIMLADALEVQNVTATWASLASRGGYFVLSYGPCPLAAPCATTSRLSHDTSASALKLALELLPGVGVVDVQYTLASDHLSAAWLVTFRSACDMLSLTVVDTSIASLNIASPTQGVCSHVSATLNGTLPFPFVNSLLVQEVQGLSVNASSCASLSSCSFAMTFRGFTSASLPYTATPAQVKAALEGLASVGTVDVTATYAGLLSTFTIAFRPTSGYSLAHIEMYGDLPSLLLSSSTIAAQDLTVSEVTKGESPFAASVVAETIVASACTAVHSPGVAGADGLTTGVYGDSTSFMIESRDAFSNRVFSGPVQEVQVVEVYTNGSSLGGSFALRYGDYSVEINAGAGVDDFAAALQLSLHVGAVKVSTTSATTATTLLANVTEGGFEISLTADPSTVFSVGDWVRLTNNSTGPVFTVSALDAIGKSITLSKPYPLAAASAVAVYRQPKTGYQYVVSFDSVLGDAPAFVVDPSKLVTVGGVATAAVTACDHLTTQSIRTASSGGTVGGTFYLQVNGARTPDLPYNVSGAAMQASLEAIDGLYSASVARAAAAAGAHVWVVTLVSYDDSVFPLPISAEGGLLQHAYVTVDSSYCPSSASSAGASVAAVSGRIGESFFAQLTGETTSTAEVAYAGEGVFRATYLTPREGSYNLTVAKAERGGLVGVYYNNRWLFGEPAFSRVDPFMAFEWSADDTITPTGRDYISVRWTGLLLPAFSEVYTMVVTVDDGARVWIDNELIMDEFNNTVAEGGAPSVFAAATPRALVASQLVSVKIEYRESTHPCPDTLCVYIYLLSTCV